MEIPIAFGSVIKLRHVATNHYLSALEDTYPAPSSEQNIVVAIPSDGDDTDWIVAPAFGTKIDPGRVIQDLDIIRVRHRQTQRYLHSHKTHAEPLGNNQEVTAFPQNPDEDGDTNDDWRIHIVGGGTWSHGKAVTFEHVGTSNSDSKNLLYSNPDFKDTDFTRDLQGVVCVVGEEPNSKWLAICEIPSLSMRLNKVRIKRFRSVKDEIEVPIDRFVTVLIGANDHGKSNLLSAIQSLNDERPFSQDDLNWDALDNTSTASDAPTVEWDFTASVAEPTTKFEITFARSGLGGNVFVKSVSLEEFRDQFRSLLKARPRVELFRAQEKTYDEVSDKELDSPSHEFMKGLFIKAGLWKHRHEIFKQNSRTAYILNEASAKLTAVLQHEWEQGKDLKWKFEHIQNGDAIRLHISDPAVESRYVGPSQRSSGFAAFFVLSLTTFARTSSQRAQGYIYLFDEPGTYLHPIAQINLQRVFESLAENHQLVYTTHSMFLVNKNNPKRNIVVRKSEMGTMVNKKPYAGNWKAVRESLGILLSHNFLIAEHTLLVEGASDPVYLLSCLGKLVQSDLVDIDLNDFSIMDGGDERNYVAMAKIMLDEGRQVVALLDGDEHGRKLKERLEKVAPSALKDHRLWIELLPIGCSIEDLLIVPDLYKQALVNAVDELVEKSVLEFDTGHNSDELVAELLNKPTTTTLGKHTEELTKRLLGESVSKLNVAMKYEDALSGFDKDLIVPNTMNELIEKLRQHLKLHGRKAERQAIQET